ncbi:MAG: RNA polymerase sigma factor [Bacteroidales bacterium]
MNDEGIDDVLLQAYRFAYSLSNNKEEAEDLLHDACVRILKKNLPLNVWYFIPVIRNLFIDKKRRAKRFLNFNANFNRSSTVYVTANPEPVLELALAKLKPEERELLYLFIVEEYTAQELSELLEKPRGTILSTVHRAKQKLKILMDEKSISNG